MLQAITHVTRHVAENGSYNIMASDAEGREYILLDAATGGFVGVPFEASLKLADKILVAGKINLNLWSCRTPYGTAAWLLDGMEDRQIEDERFGW